MFIRDDEIENILTEVAKPITDIAKVKNIRFNIIVDDSLNAFVIGGRDVFINSGLLTKFKNNPEVFVGVFAHELGHLLAKHVIKKSITEENSSKKNIIGMILGGLAIASGAGDIGQMLILGGMHMSYADILRHSRQNESEADKISAILLNKSGVGTGGLMTLFSIFRKSQEGQFANSYFLTHPLSRERVTFLKNYENQATNVFSPEQIHKFYRAALKLEAFTSSSVTLYNSNEVPNEIDRNYANSIINMRIGKITESINLLTSNIEVEKENPYFYELMGQLYLSKGNSRQAADNLKTSYDLAKGSKELITMEYVTALLSLNKGVITKKEIEFSMQKIGNYLLYQPGDPGKLKMMANLYALQGQKDYSNYYLAEREYYLGNQDKSRVMLNFLKKNNKNPKGLEIKINDLLDLIENR
jgi:predicted Zn-dependent protease